MYIFISLVVCVWAMVGNVSFDFVKRMVSRGVSRFYYINPPLFGP